jgi:hypothetical protein
LDATRSDTAECQVVYRFDSVGGDELEMRYPLSKKDVERLELFEESDNEERVIR